MSGDKIETFGKKISQTKNRYGKNLRLDVLELVTFIRRKLTFFFKAVINRVIKNFTSLSTVEQRRELG